MVSLKRGFTLVELSIVIIIIGIIALSVIGGSTLVSTSKATLGIKELKEYISLISVYKSTYNQLPGDSVNPNDPTNTSASAVGNANGEISWGCHGVSCNSNESLNSWYHMTLSGLITSTFSSSGPALTATAPVISNAVTSGVGQGNIPASGLSANAGYVLMYVLGGGADAAPSFVDYAAGTNVVLLGQLNGGAVPAATCGTTVASGSFCTASGSNTLTSTPGATFVPSTAVIPYGASISTSVVSAIDRKYDNALPTTGNCRYLDNAGQSYFSCDLAKLMS